MCVCEREREREGGREMRGVSSKYYVDVLFGYLRITL